MRYYLIAGEASGDLHGSNLIRALRQCDPKAEFRFWGGDMMLAAAEGEAAQDNGEAAQAALRLRASHSAQAEGVAAQDEGVAAQDNGEAGSPLVRHYRDGAVMGVTQVLGKAFKLLGNIRFCKEDILAWRPDVVILIDYPGFNMRIAKFCHERHIRVYYYIAPKTWASREGRNRKLKAYVDKMFIVFPFELPYFTQKGIPFEYHGNPLLDAIDAHDYRRPVEGQYIAVLAGSRKDEISRMMPVCMEVADALSALPRYKDCRFVVAGAPARDAADYQKFIGSRSNVDLIFGRSYDILRYADSAIVNSGTASLEAALIGTPQVVCWSSSALTYFVAAKILKVKEKIKYISLGNLCVDRLVFRELLQYEFNVGEVLSETRRLNEDAAYRRSMLDGYAEIRSSLGSGGASLRIAQAILESLR